MTNTDKHVAVYDESQGLYVWSGTYQELHTDLIEREWLSQDEADELGLDSRSPAQPDATKLSDLDLFRELTLNDLADYDEAYLIYPTDDLQSEIDKRWGKDAMERVAQVITGGKYSPDDELRMLADDSDGKFMKLVRGEITPDEWFED